MQRIVAIGSCCEIVEEGRSRGDEVMKSNAETSRKPANRTARPRGRDASGSSRVLAKTLIATTFSFQPRCLAQSSKPDVSVMSSDRVLDYLTEELVVEKNIVRPSCRTSFIIITEPMSLSLSLPGDVSLSKPCSRNPRESG